MLNILKQLRKVKHARLGIILLAVLLLNFTFIGKAGAAHESLILDPEYVDRVADPSTMDAYIDAMLGGYDKDKKETVNPYGSRFAGQVWADKSVFANGKSGIDFDGSKLKLDPETDGLETEIELDEDFLHVFSVLGSSRQVIGETPIDLVMVLDVSGSMGNPTLDDSKIYQSLDAMNKAIQNLMSLNEKNRVGVVVFASYPKVLMPLDHYEPIKEGDNKQFIKVTEYSVYSNQDNNPNDDSNSDWYVYDIEAVQNNDTGKRTIHTGSGNGTGGDGTSGTDYIGSNTNIDAGMWVGLEQLANAENTTTELNGEMVSSIPAFIFLGDGDPQIEMNWENGEWWNVNPEQMTNTEYFDDVPVILSTIMHTAFMKSAVINNYRSKAQNSGIKSFENIDLSFYTIGIEIGQTGHDGYGPQAAQAILDPGDTARDGQGFNEKNTSKRVDTYVVQEAYRLWKDWLKGQEVTANTLLYDKSTRTFKQLGTNKWGVIQKQVEDNINYTDKYFDAESAEQLSSTLDKLVTEIATPALVPVYGINASGIESSVTYTDPIGAYMEIKDVTDLTVFGKRYNLEKIGVYDYKTNLEIFNKGGDNVVDTTNGKRIAEGWYDENNERVTDTAKQNWEDAVYRISFETASEHIPTLDHYENIQDKEQNTVFTFYHICNENGINPSDDSWKTIVNPCYEAGAMNSSTTLNVDDLHIWIEDTGDYYDEYGNDNIIDAGFQQALYVNLPIEAIPLQVATVTIKNETTVSSFVTNLEEYVQSTPLRLFYEVGFSNDYINENHEPDLALIPHSYQMKHTLVNEEEGTKKVYFNSNYFSGQSYEEYVSEVRSYEQGNPSVTFSPADDNSFYLFQQPRLLYFIPNVEQLDREVYTRPSNLELGPLENVNKDTILNAINTQLKDNGITCSIVDNINTNMTTDDWYYIVREYYSGDDKGGEIRYMALARKGAEFGSGIGGDKIPMAEYLCWFDPETNSVSDYDMSKEDRGKPGPSYYVAARTGGLRVGGLSELIGTKGSKISVTASFAELEDNPTDTADNFYLPTISTESTDDNVVINLFLGNNGRIDVDNSSLLLTKTVNSVSGVLTEEQKNQEFSFDVEIAEFQGNHNAIVVLRDEFDPSLWRRRFDSIDVLLNNHDLLQNADNTLTMVDSDGKRIGYEKSTDKYYYLSDDVLDYDLEYDPQESGGPYYVYIGENLVSGIDTGAVNTFRVFQADENNLFGNKTERGGRTFYVAPGQHELSEENERPIFKLADEQHQAGERVYWVDQVWLIPKNLIDDNKFDEINEEVCKTLTQFEIANLIVFPGKTSDTELNSPYAIRSNYMTVNINTEDPVKLKDGEGLLFYGLKSNENYSITEDLSDSKTIFFQEATQISNGGTISYYPKGFTTDNYKVVGTTSYQEDAVHYVNLLSSIEKKEMKVGENQPVKTNDQIDYLIHWENFAFDNLANNNKKSEVIVTDTLDPGVDFKKAVFDPDFGNIINQNYAPELFLNQMDPDTESPYVDQNPDNNIVLEIDKIPENRVGMFVQEMDFFDEKGIHQTLSVPVHYDFKYSENKVTGNYRYADYYNMLQSFNVIISYNSSTHEVIWDISNAPVSTYGALGLEVAVNKDAKYEWNPTDKVLDKSKTDLEVLNQAKVKVGNYPNIETEIIENPLGQPSKTETLIERGDIQDQEASDNSDENTDLKNDLDIDPETVLNDSNIETNQFDSVSKRTVSTSALSDSNIIVDENNLTDNNSDGIYTGPLVFVGDKVTYQIDFANYNYNDEYSTVIITDKLDPGVNFVSAGFLNTTLTNQENIASPKININESDPAITGDIEYHSDTHTVVWNLIDCPALYEGKVYLVVEVNDKAIKTWFPGDSTSGEDTDFMIYNRASVQVGNDDAVLTDIIENPLGIPGKANIRVEKTVTGEYSDPDRIFHFVLTLEDSDLTGVYGDLTFTNGISEFTLKNNETKTAIGLPDGLNYEIVEIEANLDGYSTSFKNNNNKGTLTANTEITVYCENNKDLPDDFIPEKVELTPGNLEKVLVGDQITYQISYKNLSNDSTDITVVDILDEGVDFISSDAKDYEVIELTGEQKIPDGINTEEIDYPYDKYFVTTIKDVAPNTGGYVTLTVQVNENATLINQGDEVAKVNNIAFVKNGYSQFIQTNEVENPLEPNEGPKKKEISHEDNAPVKVGEILEYEITYKNTSNTTRNITLKDPLCVGLEFVSASGNGSYNPSESLTGINISQNQLGYEYNGVVTWTFNNVPKGETVSATVKVRVTKDALKKNEVHNKAIGKIGNESWVLTEDPQNPINNNTNLTITKQVVGTGSSTNLGFMFQATFTMAGIPYTSAVLDSNNNSYTPTSNGIITFSLKASESITFVNLPEGLSYQVEELNAQNYTVSWTGPNVINNQVSGSINSTNTQALSYTCYNTTGGQHKAELTPGNGEYVVVNQNITYAIYWENTSTVPETIIIEDPLDKGLNFISCSEPGTYNPAGILSSGNNSKYQYNGVITWNLGIKQPGEKGQVNLVVQPNQNGLINQIVENQAFVEVGNTWFITENVNNPLSKPSKTEITPGNGEYVEVGDQITYEIQWVNNTNQVGDIIIYDPIDYGVEFVSASNGGTYNLNNALPNNIVVDYDYYGVVIWTIKNAPVSASGTVTLTVEVLKSALLNNIVKNQAVIQSVDGQYYLTEEPENPIIEPQERELDTPTIAKYQAVNNGSMTNSQLSANQGDYITYYLKVTNPSTTELSNIQVTDTVPDGLILNPQTISNNGTVNQNTQTIEWNIASLAPGDSIILSYNAQIPSELFNATVYKNTAYLNYDGLEIPSNEVVVVTLVDSINSITSGSTPNQITRTSTSTVNNTPSTNTTSVGSSPNTGVRNNNIILYLGLILVSIIGVSILFYFQRKNLDQ